MPIHWFWIIALLIVVGVVIGLLAAFARGARGDGAHRPPVLSPDGRYWWDGQRWQPMPPASPQASPPASTSGSGTA